MTPITATPDDLLDEELQAPTVPVAGIAPLAAMRPIEVLHKVEMEVTVELGRTHMPLKDLLALGAGAVVELDRTAGAPVDVLVNGALVARGEVVVVDDEYGVRITEIISDRN